VTGEVLSRRALNRSLLARQHLLERCALPLPVAIEQVGGLQTQYAPAGYIGLWSRLAGLSRDALTRALFGRSVIQGTLMRSTIHMVSATDYWRLAGGIREGRRAWFLRTHARPAGGIDMEAVARAIRGLLADGPRRRSELVRALDEAGFPAVAWSGAGLWVDMVRVPPSGTWERRRADLFGLAEAWVGPDVTSVMRYTDGPTPFTLAAPSFNRGVMTVLASHGQPSVRWLRALSPLLWRELDRRLPKLFARGLVRHRIDSGRNDDQVPLRSSGAEPEAIEQR